MKPYSLDLRHRVVEAYHKGNLSQKQLAQQFAIAPATVQRWIQQKRRSGSLAPKAIGGSKSKLDATALAHLAHVIETMPDATLAQWAQVLEEQTGIRLHPSTLWRQARRAGWTRKKRP